MIFRSVKESPETGSCPTVDFGAGQIQVRDGKGLKDRITVLPGALTESLRAQMARVRSLPERDLKAGHGRVLLPCDLRRKHPYADREPGWQWMFPPTLDEPGFA